MDFETNDKYNLLEQMLLDLNKEPTDLPLSLLKAITNNFSEDQKIGSGEFADVYEGILDIGSVAVKRLSQAILHTMDESNFDREVTNLIRVKHQNVVRFLGYCADTQRRAEMYCGRLVMACIEERLLCFEFLPNGNLDKHLRDVASGGLEWRTCYQIIKGLCMGLHYLHQQNIVHLDLKPANILLDCNMVPKISGFQLSRGFLENQTDTYTSNLVGTLGYMAPELFMHRVITIKSDIYSLGIIISEILTGQKRYFEIESVLESWSTRFQMSHGGLWLEHVRLCAKIGLECMDFDPERRPTTPQIIYRLHELERTYGFIETNQSAIPDNDDRVNSLDDLLHDVTAEPIKVPLAVLQSITQNFADARKIGQGGFGIVYEGVLATGSVAVKKLLNSRTIEDEQFYGEADILMRVRHKNIVRFLGYCSHTEHEAKKIDVPGSRQKFIYHEIRERLLCFDYMRNGGLDRHLTDELRGLEWRTRYQIIKGICGGLQYLHNEGIVHKDLKPTNILLDDHMVPKITDFGTSTYLDGVSRYVTKQCLATLGYCAPEYLQRCEVSLKADIFSLGAVIRDIVTGRKQDIDSKNEMRNRWNRSDKYPPLGYQQISKCIEIARRCIVEDPKLRPNIWDIIIDLNKEEITNEHITNAVESMVGQISPYSWELLEIDPLELNFSFEPNKQIQCSIELNNERDDYIAFNIQKPGVLNYFVEPNKGIMPPHSRSSVTVTLQASNRAPDAMLCKDSFIVRCAIVDDGLTAANVNEDVFDTKLGKVVDEVMLTVAFT